MFSALNTSKILFKLSQTVSRNLYINKIKPLLTNFPKKKNCTFRNSRFLCTNVEIEYAEPIIPESARGDEQLEHKFKVIVLEAEVLRQEGKNVPSNVFLKELHWEELLKLETRTARKRYLDFLFKIEKKKENEAYRKAEKRIIRENTFKEVPADDSHIRYDLGHNNIFLRFYDTTINNMYNNRLMQAMQFGQQLIIDCGYHSDMTSRENVNCAKQLMLLFSENRAHDDPFDLHLCNAEPKTTLMHSLNRFIPCMYEKSFPLNIHEESYIDVFNKDQLVYLTPDCREEMVEYDHNAIYIIGGIVDKVNNEPLSMAKAKREGIRMLKLPLDKYLQWNAGSGKCLTLNQVVSIMLDIKRTGDWNFAFNHVPRRKIIDYGRDNTNHVPFDGNNRRGGYNQSNDEYRFNNRSNNYGRTNSRNNFNDTGNRNIFEKKSNWKPRTQSNNFKGRTINVRSLYEE